MSTFTLASFNICSAHFREGHYTEDNLARLAACIRESHADVVALQEVDRGAARSERVDMPARLSELSGLAYHYFIKIRDFQGGEYGTAILSRYPIRESRTMNYPVRIATQGTSCGSVVLDVNGTSVTVYNTHLSCETEEANTETLHASVKFSTRRAVPISCAETSIPRPARSPAIFLTSAAPTRNSSPTPIAPLITSSTPIPFGSQRCAPSTHRQTAPPTITCFFVK